MGSCEEDSWLQQVMEVTRVCQEQRDNPLLWAVEVGKCLKGAGVTVPSVELGQMLISHLCWSNNVPIVWKYIDQVIASHMVPSLLVLALLTSRVIPCRRIQPEAYRLYLELLSKYSISFTSPNVTLHSKKTVEVVDDALQLSQTFGTPVTEPGKTAVLFTFTMVSNLVNAIAEDSGLQVRLSEKQCRLGGTVGQHDMAIGANEDTNEKRREHQEHLRRTNIVAAIEVVKKLMEYKRTSTFFRLACQNMPEQWNGLYQRLQILEAHTSSASLKINGELFGQLTRSIQRSLSLEYQPSQHQAIRALINSGFQTSSVGHNYGIGPASPWLPLDLFMEDMMDVRQLSTTSAIEVLAELTKSLQAVNGASWQETFLGLWTAVLRLVQREREPFEGPLPQLDSRLCLLLCITPLVVVSIIEEEEKTLQAAKNSALGNISIMHEHDKERKVLGSGTRRAASVSSLQLLGQFDELIKPPESVVSAANHAAFKAARLVSRFNCGTGSFDVLSSNGISSAAVGSMWHLIVEACIARNLLDSSAYLWPGYIQGQANSLSHTVPTQESPWFAFMGGTPLSASLKDALIKTPASSFAELEKVYQIAMNGPEEDRPAMASILCGASFIRGWNVQEHVVRLVVNLLSPPVPADYHGPGSHLVACAPLLNAVLKGITTFDTVHVLSLHGMAAEVAAALMPICETFGSILPTVPQTSRAGEEVSVYTIFSNAFLLLLRLWKFYGCPHAHSLSGRGAPVGSELALEYLLLVHNSRVAKDNESFQVKKSSFLGTTSHQVPISSNDQTVGATSSISKPLFIDSFPQLKVWYCQHQACIASTLSGLVPGNPVHQIADRLLNMMYWKLGKVVAPSITSGPSGSSSLSSSSGGGGDTSRRPLLSAWEVLGAVPFVVDAVLTACAHGKLSPRDLITGIRDLVDFLPASIATIVSYFSAEVTRGIWKYASMNGTDWPSPAANLSSIEAEIKEILADTGVHVPSLVIGRNLPATLPLPLAALVSLTITFKLDKHSDLMTGIAGAVLETAAAGSPWPCMPIVAALWSQKVRRWHDFIVFHASRTVFMHDTHAVVQLLRSCFAATLGSTNSLMPKLTVHGGVGALLGHGFSSHSSPCGTCPAAPAILYLRSYRSMYDVTFLAEAILSLVAGAARDFAPIRLNCDPSGQSHRVLQCLRSHNVSLANALARVKQASSLGASIFCISGGLGLVQMLYQETLPTWFLSQKRTKPAAGVSTLEGYAIAYFSFLCGAFTWGVGTSSFSKKRAQIVGTHMDFLASAIDGNISMGCEHATWRAYVLGFLAMVVNCSPNWICEVNLEILKKLAKRLKWWHEPELALALLERGGLPAIGAAAELASGY